jgi:opacity protein-like surface antigen
MKTLLRWSALPVCAAALAAAPPALAQVRTGGASWVPYTSNGYVGLNVGSPEYDLPCTAGFACDDPDASFHLYTGGSFNEWLGAEIGYLHMGKADRQGGTTRGHGINLSLVGTWPVAQSFSVFGKVGTTYGRTTVSANSAANEPVGDEDGFGLSYGAGVQYDFNPQWALVGQWDRHEMKFAGRGKQDVDALSVGVKFKF